MQVKINGRYVEYSQKGFREKLEEEFSQVSDKSVFFNYPHDESFFSARYGLKIFQVPQGYVAVNKWFGQVDKNRPVKGSGLRMMFGLFGFGQGTHVINTKTRTEDLSLSVGDEKGARDHNLITKDNVPLTRIDATLNYHVSDPAKAIAAGDFRNTVFNRAIGRVVDYVGTNRLEQLLEGNLDERNLTTDNRGRNIPFPDVDLVGVTMTNLYLTDIDYPHELRGPLTQGVVGEQEKIKRERNAEAEAYEITQRGQAVAQIGTVIQNIPGAILLQKLATYDKVATGPNNTIITVPELNVNLNTGRGDNQS